MEPLLEQLLTQALAMNLTDLHFPSRQDPSILARHKGRLMPFIDLPLKTYQRLCEYLCFLANIDINHKDRAQTGSFFIPFQKQNYYFRLSYLPGQHDISMVLRLLNHSPLITLEQLTWDDEAKTQMRELLVRESGLIVLAGPTGSGKSTTLHAFLDCLVKTADKNLISVEDPIEIYQKGVIQVPINETAKMDYAAILRQILRHDPDVVMIGETRDETTAAIALRLALTGHLVLTTLHASSIPGALKRLENLGLALDDLKEVLAALLNQRLVYSRQREDPYVFFEICPKEELHSIYEGKRASYTTLQEKLRAAVLKGWLDEKEIAPYLL